MKLIRVLYRRTPPFMVALVVMQVIIVIIPPFNWFEALGCWITFGFALLTSVRAGSPYPSRLGCLYWTLREALCWPHLLSRLYRGRML